MHLKSIWRFNFDEQTMAQIYCGSQLHNDNVGHSEICTWTCVQLLLPLVKPLCGLPLPHVVTTLTTGEVFFFPPLLGNPVIRALH